MHNDSKIGNYKSLMEKLKLGNRNETNEFTTPMKPSAPSLVPTQQPLPFEPKSSLMTFGNVNKPVPAQYE